MGFQDVGRRFAVCALLAAATLTVPAVAPGVAWGEDSPASSDPVSVSEAAQTLATIRATRKTALTQIETARARATEATDQLAAARDAVTAAAAVDRTTRRRAAEAAEAARRATSAQTRATARAREAEGDLKRMARSAYINAAGNSDLALFVSFATDGPDALNAFAQRDMAYNNLSDASLVDAQRTVKVAQDATAAADEARTIYDGAAAEFDTAHDALAASRQVLKRSTADLDAAQADVAAGEAAVRKADAAYEKAQEVYKESLAASLVGVAPISSGPAADVVWRMLKAEGFSEESIAGVLGNLQQESGVDPTAMQAGGVGRGLAQWSQGGRWDNGSNSLIAFSSGRGLDPWDARTQVQFIVYEMDYVLTGFDTEMFKDMTDVVAATVYFHDIFEASADSDEFVRSVRGGYALQWYSRLS